MNNANAAVNPNSKLFIEQRPAKIPSNTKNTRENDFCIAITSVRPQSIGKRVRTGKAEVSWASDPHCELPEPCFTRIRQVGKTKAMPKGKSRNSLFIVNATAKIDKTVSKEVQ